MSEIFSGRNLNELKMNNVKVGPSASGTAYFNIKKNSSLLPVTESDHSVDVGGSGGSSSGGNASLNGYGVTNTIVNRSDLLITSQAVYNLQQSFQNGVDKIYNACVARGSTPSNKTPDAIAEAISKIGGGSSSGTTDRSKMRKFTEKNFRGDLGNYKMPRSDLKSSPIRTEFYSPSDDLFYLDIGSIGDYCFLEIEYIDRIAYITFDIKNNKTFGNTLNIKYNPSGRKNVKGSFTISLGDVNHNELYVKTDVNTWESLNESMGNYYNGGSVSNTFGIYKESDTNYRFIVLEKNMGNFTFYA